MNNLSLTFNLSTKCNQKRKRKRNKKIKRNDTLRSFHKSTPNCIPWFLDFYIFENSFNIRLLSTVKLILFLLISK